MYLVKMPGNAPGENRDWYCDANNVGGNTCWEQDIFESTSNTVSTMHNWGDGGGTVFARGGGFDEADITFKDGRTIEAPWGSGTASSDLGSGEGSGIATSLWFCNGWPGFDASTHDRCNPSSTLTLTDWEITESQ